MGRETATTVGGMELRRASEVGRPARLSVRSLRWVTAAYFGATTLVGLWLWQSWISPYATRLVDDFASLTGVLFAAGCAGWATRAAHGRARLGWFAMTAGLLAWAVGEAIWTYYEVWLRYEQAPSPSWADAGYLLFPVGAGVAVWLLTASSKGQSRGRLVLDGVIVASSIFVIWWVAVLDNVVHAGATNLALAVSLAYPIADAVIVTIALSRAVAAYRPSLGLLIGGLMVIALSDSAFAGLTAVGGYYTGNLIDLGWIVGCGLLGLAALRSVGEPRAVEPRTGLMPSRTRILVPYVPMLLAVTVGLYEALPQLTSVVLAGSGGLLLVAVLARQFLVLVENRRLLSDVTRLAFQDQLTGLANRALFVDRLEQAVARQRREGKPLVVLCLDLDDFKKVNDDLGHPAGDELLVRVARRLADCLRSTDTVARLGGDEFAILIEGSIDDGLAAGDRILATFDSPIMIDGVDLTVRPSVGLTLSTADMAATVDELVRQADLAMYAAKRDGGGCIRSFIPDLPDPYELPQGARSVPASRTAAGSVADDDAESKVQPLAHVARAGRWPPLGVRVALGVLAIGTVGFALSTLVRASPGRVALLDNGLESALLLSAAGLVGFRACRIAAERSAWLLIAAGMTATGMATVVYAVWVPEGRLPSVADPVFLAFYPLVYIGLLLLLRGQLRRVPTLIRFDAVVVAFTAVAVGAALMAGPIEATTHGSPATGLVAMAYPIGGLLLLALTSGSVAILGWRTNRRWTLLIVGFAVWVLANVVYLFQAANGSYLEGTWIDACWPTSFLLIALASWVPATSGSVRPKVGTASLVPPIVCSIIALTVAMFAYGDRIPVTLAALSLVAVAARLAMTFRDASALAESHEQAMTDELTRLANRWALATALTAAPATKAHSTTSDRPAQRLAVLLAEVVQFREIIDSLGRNVADDLLCRTARRISKAVRYPGLVARTGNQQFAVLLNDGVNLMTARAQAGFLMDAVREPFALDHITVQVDVRIAIALWPDHCAHPQDLLRLAEATMDDSRLRHQRITVYDASADVHRSHDAQFIEELHTALSSERQQVSERGAGTGEAPPPSQAGTPTGCGRMLCHYQPKISAENDAVHSVEALVRWHHPVRGLLLPDQFLPVAERAGLMRLVATRVLDIALAQISSWRDQGIDLTVAVNLSATNLLDLDLVDMIDRLLQTHRLPSDALILEITEDTLTTDSQRSRNTVRALRRLGIRLSLDDYGTGWSSLARLQDLSVDELKLDKIFVARLARDPRSIAIVRSTVALAHSLGADLVAEGVEDMATLRALRQYGCTITQGHVHSPPLPADELQAWLFNRLPQLAVSRQAVETLTDSRPDSDLRL